MNQREQFFHEHAGYSYAPPETPTQGRERCATELAAAELWALEQGISFRWEYDDLIDSSEFDDDPSPWALWECLAHDEDGEIIASLHGIDFGRGGRPWAAPYRRVAEAEIASELQGDSQAA